MFINILYFSILIFIPEKSCLTGTIFVELLLLQVENTYQD